MKTETVKLMRLTVAFICALSADHLIWFTFPTVLRTVIRKMEPRQVDWRE